MCNDGALVASYWLPPVTAGTDPLGPRPLNPWRCARLHVGPSSGLRAGTLPQDWTRERRPSGPPSLSHPWSNPDVTLGPHLPCGWAPGGNREPRRAHLEERIQRPCQLRAAAPAGVWGSFPGPVVPEAPRQCTCSSSDKGPRTGGLQAQRVFSLTPRSRSSGSRCLQGWLLWRLERQQGVCPGPFPGFWWIRQALALADLETHCPRTPPPRPQDRLSRACVPSSLLGQDTPCPPHQDDLISRT